MDYTKLQQYLINSFDLNKKVIEIPEIDSSIELFDFHSNKEENACHSYSAAMQEAFMGYNSLSYQNLHFKYPVFIPKGEKAKNAAIVLLHGLNERSWDKYLAWAHQLSSETGKSVILFPISLHMNRSPKAWSDPRQMLFFVKTRKKFLPTIQNTSVANVALSERLTNEPEQFFLSGYQSALDVIQLVQEISNGKHPFFNKGASFDFFSYSIGAFISEILLLANPDNIFDRSKCFFFCGGSAFSELNGNSKYILDDVAFDRIKEFYLNDLDYELKRKSIFSNLLTQTNLGNAFRQMVSLKHFKSTPRLTINRIKEQVSGIGLKKDEVVPIKGLKKTLAKFKVNILDFNYEYTHEMPFPLLSNDGHKEVDSAFAQVFSAAGKALA